MEFSVKTLNQKRELNVDISEPVLGRVKGFLSLTKGERNRNEKI